MELYIRLQVQTIAAAFAIAGHHAGLPNGGARADKGGTLNGRLSAKPGIDIPDYREFLRQVEIPEVPIRTFLRTETLEAVFSPCSLHAAKGSDFSISRPSAPVTQNL